LRETVGDRYTEAAYSRLQAAYDEMNRALFQRELPSCLMTWQRGKAFVGYFSPDRFKHRQQEGTRTHEIALNPDCFRSDIEVMQTLVHEMVHLWQHVAGKPSQRTYHNKEWAAKMEAVGLMPSSTGQPGGARTGQKMSDYPIAGGPFEFAVVAFLSAGPVVEWHSMPPSLAATAGAGSEPEEGEGKGEESAPTDKKRKVKYTCPGCGANVWGKPTLKLVCGQDGKHFEARA
jgi:predicted SprT family Zn-dependent metalloprotease